MANDVATKRPPKPKLTDLMKGGVGGARPRPTVAPEESITSPDAARLLSAMEGVTPMEGDENFPIQDIPVDLIDENPLPQRSIYLEEEIREIARSLAENTQRDPIHVRPNPAVPGRFIISDGWTRVLGVKRHGAEFGLPVTLASRVRTDMDDLKGCLHGYLQNEERNALTDIDKGLLFSRMVIERRMLQKDVGALFGIKSEAEMTLYLAFGDLAPDVISLIGPHKARFSKSFAYETAKIQKAHGPRAATVAARLVTGNPEDAESKGLSLKDLKLLREKMDKSASLGPPYLEELLASLITGKPVGAEAKQSRVGPKKERFSEYCVVTDHGTKMDIKLSQLDATRKAALMERLRPILQDFFSA